MSTEGTDLQSAAASAVASVDAEAPADTNADTSVEAGHTPEVDPTEAHIKWLQENHDKIPADKLSFLDRKFQPEFTRRLNLLNGTKQSIEQNATALAERAGIQIPEGKTAYDLMFEEGGKGFFDAVAKAVDNQIAPVKEHINAQSQNVELQRMMNLAQANFPEVKENFPEVLKRVDADPELLTLGTSFGGKALPYVLAGVGYQVKAEALAKENADLKKQLDATKVAVKAGSSTTKASGGAAKGGTGRAPTLMEIAKAAYAEATSSE